MKKLALTGSMLVILFGASQSAFAIGVPNRLPDSGSTLGLLGLSLVGMALLLKRKK